MTLESVESIADLAEHCEPFETDPKCEKAVRILYAYVMTGQRLKHGLRDIFEPLAKHLFVRRNRSFIDYMAYVRLLWFIGNRLGHFELIAQLPSSEPTRNYAEAIAAVQKKICQGFNIPKPIVIRHEFAVSIVSIVCDCKSAYSVVLIHRSTLDVFEILKVSISTARATCGCGGCASRMIATRPELVASKIECGAAYSQATQLTAEVSKRTGCNVTPIGPILLGNRPN